MATNISVPVLWDATGNFLNGALMGVSTEATVIGTVPKPSGIGIPGYAPPASVDTLQVKDPQLGDLYLDITLAEWRVRIQPPQQSPNVTKPLTYTIGVDEAASSAITNTDLYGTTLLQVWVDGVELDIRDMVLEPYYSSTEGKLGFGFTLVDGQVVSILCYNN